ncbi:hypothetical protein BC829DRAFT_469923 [Chytridium lagenaria]|nr:hypothetical protein BC829DRAFT_469923 [Chytridium lagenaria]
MSMAAMTTPADGVTVNVGSIFNRCHDLVVFVKASPQREALLGNRIEIKQKEVYDKSIRGLIQDVRTRWNSTFAMIARILILRFVLVTNIF